MDYRVFKYLALVSQIGFVMAIPIFGMVFVGSWLDNLFHTRGILLIICILAGIYMAFYNLYRIVMKNIDDGKKDSKR